MNQIVEINQDSLMDALEYDPHVGVFIRRKSRAGFAAGSLAGSVTVEGYVRINIYQKHYMAHRLAWLYVFGRWPTPFIDHINQVKDDNRICNLREVSHSQNMQNRKSTKNKSSIPGVHWVSTSKKWRAEIKVNGLVIPLGLYKNKLDAGRAYEAAKIKHHPFYVPKTEGLSL